MTEERLKMINKIAEEMKSISEVVNKIKEGFEVDVRLKFIRTIESFSVYPYLSEAQRSEIEELVILSPQKTSTKVINTLSLKVLTISAVRFVIERCMKMKVVRWLFLHTKICRRIRCQKNY